MYDVNIDPVRFHFAEPVPFRLLKPRDPQYVPLSAELDYQPDVSAAYNSTIAEASKAGMIGITQGKSFNIPPD